MKGDEHMCTAKEVSHYIVKYCAKKGTPISNLQLQKILYFAWRDYYQQTKSALFQDEICAWQLGAVVPEVYYEYCPYGGLPIRTIYDDNQHSEIDKSIDIDILQHIVDKYRVLSARELVNMSHKKGDPWDLVYNDGEGHRKAIPFDLIKEHADGVE